MRRLLADRGWTTAKRYRSGKQMDNERRKYKKIERRKAKEDLDYDAS